MGLTFVFVPEVQSGGRDLGGKPLRGARFTRVRDQGLGLSRIDLLARPGIVY
jgi:hypothetical protein